jgi:mono/diheme cytochrome c family protein
MRALITLSFSLAILAAGSVAQADPDAEKGQQVYTIFCATCHGPAGDGQGPVGKTLVPPPRDFTVGEFKFGGADQDIFDIISNGAASKGGSPLMAPWGAVIPENDRWAIVAFIRTLMQSAPEVSSE